jgi:redox-sensitive bicupin YhaK (pirin superfamily)
MREYITCVLRGEVEHGDGLGNRDVIAPGVVKHAKGAR